MSEVSRNERPALPHSRRQTVIVNNPYMAYDPTVSNLKGHRVIHTDILTGHWWLSPYRNAFLASCMACSSKSWISSRLILPILDTSRCTFSLSLSLSLSLFPSLSLFLSLSLSLSPFLSLPHTHALSFCPLLYLSLFLFPPLSLFLSFPFSLISHSLVLTLSPARPNPVPPLLEYRFLAGGCGAGVAEGDKKGK